MADKKLTDNEIKKALECCMCVESADDCNKCPYAPHRYDLGCIGTMMKNALDYINRLEAENERLTKCRKEEVEKLMSATDKVITEAKSEARKEFAERLCKRMGYCDLPNVIVRNHIDSLLKEMEGE